MIFGYLIKTVTHFSIFFRRSNIVSNLNPQKFCDPLGDSNIWASLYPLVENPDKKNETKPIEDFKYIVVAARLDTTSLFEKTAGANSPITGVVTLLTTAKYLKDILGQEDIIKGNNLLKIIKKSPIYM